MSHCCRLELGVAPRKGARVHQRAAEHLLRDTADSVPAERLPGPARVGGGAEPAAQLRLDAIDQRGPVRARLLDVGTRADSVCQRCVLRRPRHLPQHLRRLLGAWRNNVGGGGAKLGGASPSKTPNQSSLVASPSHLPTESIGWFSLNEPPATFPELRPKGVHTQQVP